MTKNSQFLFSLILATTILSSPVVSQGTVVQVAPEEGESETITVTPEEVKVKVNNGEAGAHQEINVQGDNVSIKENITFPQEDAQSVGTLPAVKESATLNGVAGLNLRGYVSHLTLKKGKHGHHHLEVTLRDGRLSGYQTTPKEGRVFLSVDQANHYLLHHPVSQFKVDLSSTLSPHPLYLTFAHVKRISSTTLRFDIKDSATLKALKAFVAMQKASGPHDIVSLHVANFVEVKGKTGKATDYKHREDYQVFAKGGVTFHHLGGARWKATFRGVTAHSLSGAGVSTELTADALVKALQSRQTLADGRTIDFAPNGDLTLFDDQGTPFPVVMKFSNFRLESGAITAEAEPLRAIWSADDVVLPRVLLTSPTVTSQHPTTVFLDSFPANRGGW